MYIYSIFILIDSHSFSSSMQSISAYLWSPWVTIALKILSQCLGSLSSRHLIPFYDSFDCSFYYWRDCFPQYLLYLLSTKVLYFKSICLLISLKLQQSEFAIFCCDVWNWKGHLDTRFLVDQVQLKTFQLTFWIELNFDY